MIHKFSVPIFSVTCDAVCFKANANAECEQALRIYFASAKSNVYLKETFFPLMFPQFCIRFRIVGKSSGTMQ